MRRGSHSIRDPRRRRLSAEAHHDQRRSCRAWSTPATRGSGAHRHRAAPYRRRRRADLRSRHRRLAPGAGARRHRSRSTSISSSAPPPRRTAPSPPPPCASRPASASPRAPPSTCRPCARASSTRWPIADNFLKTGQFKRAIVVGAETFSRILDWEDRGTCVLFGDGAGAVVLEAQTPARQPRGPRHPGHAHPLRRPLRGPALRRRRPRLDQDHRAICA